MCARLRLGLSSKVPNRGDHPEESRKIATMAVENRDEYV
jgi:hypothetical protein